jgi:hypothetical protein
MSKIILEFDGIEEATEARDALDGYKWKGAMWDLDQELRSVVKYGSSMTGTGEASSEEQEIADKMREKLRDILSDWNIQFD